MTPGARLYEYYHNGGHWHYLLRSCHCIVLWILESRMLQMHSTDGTQSCAALPKLLLAYLIASHACQKTSHKYSFLWMSSLVIIYYTIPRFIACTIHYCTKCFCGVFETSIYRAMVLISSAMCNWWQNFVSVLDFYLQQQTNLYNQLSARWF